MLNIDNNIPIIVDSRSEWDKTNTEWNLNTAGDIPVNNLISTNSDQQSESQTTTTTSVVDLSEYKIEETNKKFKFDPPLYLQRYDHLCDLLERLSCNSWMDIGCSDCRLVGRVKNFNQNLNLIVGLDIDQALLEFSKERFTQQWFDFFQARQKPLDLYIVAGDVAKLDSYFLDQVIFSSISEQHNLMDLI